MAKRTAVIDIGTNSFRLVIYEKTSRFGFHIIHEEKERVRISEGAFEFGGILQPEPLERAFFTLKLFSQQLQNFSVRKILCVATSAMRDAPNANLFIRQVKRELGIHIKVISGEKEAYFGGIACANLLPIKNGVTIDIGGGSTEFARIQNNQVIETISLDIGTVRLKETLTTLEEKRHHLQTVLQQLPHTFHNQMIIGIGGTIRAISKAWIRQNEYPYKKIHALEYDCTSLTPLLERLIKHSDHLAKLKQLSIKPDRLDIIGDGATILFETLHHLNAQKMITSGVGVREGVYLNDLLRNQNHQFPHGFNPSLRSLQDRFLTEDKTLHKRLQIVKKLYTLFSDDLDLSPKIPNRLIYAIKLLHIGKSLHFYNNRQQSFLLLLSNLEYKISHKESIETALLIRSAMKPHNISKYAEPYEKIISDSNALMHESELLYLAILFSDFISKERLKKEGEKQLSIQLPSKEPILERRLQKLSTAIKIAVQS
jgi:exopolyphosphatase/guanosine-5'-triphosphate,3'-diphosphate pyrophosphatase